MAKQISFMNDKTFMEIISMYRDGFNGKGWLWIIKNIKIVVLYQGSGFIHNQGELDWCVQG